jgi:transposase
MDRPGDLGGSDPWKDAESCLHSGSTPDELRERAVKMVLEIRQREGKGHGELARVGRQLGVHPEALRGWVKQAEIDNGTRPGTTTEDQRRIAELEREVRELRRANEILKAASAYFARELDPRLPR